MLDFAMSCKTQNTSYWITILIILIAKLLQQPTPQEDGGFLSTLFPGFTLQKSEWICIFNWTRLLVSQVPLQPQEAVGCGHLQGACPQAPSFYPEVEPTDELRRHSIPARLVHFFWSCDRKPVSPNFHKYASLTLLYGEEKQRGWLEAYNCHMAFIVALEL
ncbi:hypothetical protein Y1Q_0001468 [Alligator mississippiensis]|uniref:Uncharacterized protein n=1 Tax=Alligator mississippiensis TaxID=8496 RepID=A0A151M9K5_ALLMI|nr:hypothetical protein Y1Q_0001468 [Alligator mississippiensis]